MKNCAFIAAALVGGSLLSTAAAAQTTIGTVGSTGSGIIVGANQYIGETFISPGGNLNSFSVYNDSVGTGPITFNLATATGGLISAPIYSAAVTLSGATVNTIGNLSLATVAGQNYFAYFQTGSGSGTYGFATYFYSDKYSGGGFYSGGGTPTGLIFKGNVTDLSFSATFAAPNAGVPEPATWAMMILGMGAIGFATRRQKIKTRVFYAA